MSNEPTQALFVRMVTSAWTTQNKYLDDLLGSLTEAQWMQKTAPGRNSGIYLLGHLTAVNDGIIPLLDLGKRLYPALEEVFLSKPDDSGLPKPSVSELKNCWKEVNLALTNGMNKMSADDWFSRHTAVTAEAFAKEPHRNKLNILINRSIHQGYHLGQLAYLKNTNKED